MIAESSITILVDKAQNNFLVKTYIISVKPVLVDSGTCEEHGYLTIHNKQECAGAGHKAGLLDGGSGEDYKKYVSLLKKAKKTDPCGCIGLKSGTIHFNNLTAINPQCIESTKCHAGMNCICVSKGI